MHNRPKLWSRNLNNSFRLVVGSWELASHPPLPLQPPPVRLPRDKFMLMRTASVLIKWDGRCILYYGTQTFCLSVVTVATAHRKKMKRIQFYTNALLS